MNGEELLQRPVKLDFAREKGAYTPNSGYLCDIYVCFFFFPQGPFLGYELFCKILVYKCSNWSNSFQKGGQAQSHTLFVKGFDTSLGEDEVHMFTYLAC